MPDSMSWDAGSYIKSPTALPLRHGPACLEYRGASTETNAPRAALFFVEITASGRRFTDADADGSSVKLLPRTPSHYVLSAGSWPRPRKTPRLLTSAR